MVKKLRAEKATGRCAVWEGADYGPFDDPLNHLSRVKFHSDLGYVLRLTRWTGTVSFDARTYWDNGWRTTQNVRYLKIPLFNHGRPGQPWILGSALLGGVQVAFTGSVPVQRGVASIQSNGAQQGSIQTPWARWLTLGADSTEVSLYEYTPISRDSSNNASQVYMPAISVPITVWVSDEILS